MYDQPLKVTISQITWSYYQRSFEHEITCGTYRTGMPCKQNKYDQIKFNQCHPINPSMQNFCKTITKTFTALTALNKSQRQNQNRSKPYFKSVVCATQEGQLILHVFLTMNFIPVLILQA